MKHSCPTPAKPILPPLLGEPAADAFLMESGWLAAYRDLLSEVRANTSRERTHGYYADRLKQFLRWVATERLPLAAFNRKTPWNRYFEHRNAVVSPRTAHHDQICVRYFLGFCRDEGLIDRLDWLEGKNGVKVRNPPRKHVDKPTVDDVNALLQAVEDFYDPAVNRDIAGLSATDRRFLCRRLYAAVLLASYLGLRVGEIVGLDIAHYRPDLNCLHVALSKTDEGVRTLPLRSDLIAEIERYRECWPPEFAGCAKLMAGWAGGELAVRGLSKQLSNVRGKFPERGLGWLSWHKLRHFAATRTSDNILVTKSLLGHAQLETTIHYAGAPLSAAMVSAVEALEPLGARASSARVSADQAERLVNTRRMRRALRGR